MSQENVELAHRAYDAVNRRDLDGFLALMDDEVKAVSFLVAMEGEYQGHAGIRRWWQNLLDVFPASTNSIDAVATLVAASSSNPSNALARLGRQRSRTPSRR